MTYRDRGGTARGLRAYAISHASMIYLLWLGNWVRVLQRIGSRRRRGRPDSFGFNNRPSPIFVGTGSDPDIFMKYRRAKGLGRCLQVIEQGYVRAPLNDGRRIALGGGNHASTRSHFSAQDYMERAAPGDPHVTHGWLNRYLEATKKATAAKRARSAAPKKGKSGKAATTAKKTPKSAKKATGTREGSKTVKILEMLQRPEGATAKELLKMTAWQPHSLRGFISGTLGKKTGLSVESVKGENGERNYSVKA